jgi:hypothetical protein
MQESYKSMVLLYRQVHLCHQLQYLRACEREGKAATRCCDGAYTSLRFFLHICCLQSGDRAKDENGRRERRVEFESQASSGLSFLDILFLTAPWHFLFLSTLNRSNFLRSDRHCTKPLRHIVQGKRASSFKVKLSPYTQ